MKSGVSARLSITAYENLISAAERRLIINKEKDTTLRISDFIGIIPSITGKVELVYEGEQEGPAKVAHYLIGKAIRTQFVKYFPDPEKFKRTPESSPYFKVQQWFRKGNYLDILADLTNKDHETVLQGVPGLYDLVKKFHAKAEEQTRLFLMEFALHGMAEYSILSKHIIESGLKFRDLLTSMLSAEEKERGYSHFNDEDIF